MDWGGKKIKGGSLCNSQTAAVALRMSAKGKRPLHRTACIAVGLFISQNACTETFQWREGKAASRSSAYCESRAEQLLPDVGSWLKAVINPPSCLSSGPLSPQTARCQEKR